LDAATVPRVDPCDLLLGILVERHGLDVRAAQAHVRRVAEGCGVYPEVLAAAVVALLGGSPLWEQALGAGLRSAPAIHLPGPAVASLHAGTSPNEGGVGTVDALSETRAAGVESVLQIVGEGHRDATAACELLADLSGVNPDVTAMYRLAADGASLRLLGMIGVPPQVAATWQYVPLVAEIPLWLTVTDDRPLFLESAEEIEAAYPAIRGSREGAEAWASVPVHDGGRVVGAVAFSWEQPTRLDDSARSKIVRTVERGAWPMMRALHSDDSDHDLLVDLMHLIPGEWLILTTRGRGLVVDAACPNLAVRGVRPGMAPADAFPALSIDDPVMAAVPDVLAKGIPSVQQITSAVASGAPWTQAPGEVRIVRSGRRAIVTWRS
jgi:hypothetical protein